MSVQFRKHRVFRETPAVVFYDISVDDSNASDLVVHEGPAVSPPDDAIGAKQFYIHHHQVDHNRVLSGERTFELVNFDWKFPYMVWLDDFLFGLSQISLVGLQSTRLGSKALACF